MHLPKIDLWSCSWVLTPGFHSTLNDFHSLDRRLFQSGLSHSCGSASQKTGERGDFFFNKSMYWTQLILFKSGYQFLNLCVYHPYVFNEFPSCFFVIHWVIAWNSFLKIWPTCIRISYLLWIRFLEPTATYWMRTSEPEACLSELFLRNSKVLKQLKWKISWTDWPPTNSSIYFCLLFDRHYGKNSKGLS